MEKEELMELLGENDNFGILRSGQLRYRGKCPKCGRKSSIYYRKKEGQRGWICHNRECMTEFPSQKILELVDGVTLDVLNLWICSILDEK